MPRDPDHQPEPTTLLPEDAAALDVALGELARSVPVDSGRAERVAAVLALLDRWSVADPAPAVVDRLLKRVEALRDAVARPTTLCPADAAVWDARLATRQQGNTAGPLPPGSSRRAAALGNLEQLLAGWPADDAPADLADRTLARVQQLRGRDTLARLTHDTPAATGRGWSIGIRQVGSVAAVLLLSMSLLVPVLSKARNDVQEADCRHNLARAGTGLSQYADDHRDALPQAPEPDDVFSALRHFADDPRDRPGTSAVHLLVLPRDAYLRKEQLACPSAEPSFVMGGLYSSQAVEGSRALRLSAVNGPLMADTNPLYTLRSGQPVRLPGPANAASKNHGQRGQNLLYLDGSVQWTRLPLFEHAGLDDNVWTNDRHADTDGGDAQYDAYLRP